MRALAKTGKARGPRRGRATGAFTQYRRLDTLRAALETHPGGLTLDELATLLDVTTRSVRRYLEELKSITPLVSLATAPGGAHVWRIKPSERGRRLVLRRTQAYGLLAARRVFDVLRGSALYIELDNVTRQLLQLAHRPATRPSGKGEIASDQRLEDRLLYVPSPSKNYAPRGDELDELFQSVADLHAITFGYAAEPSADGTRSAHSPQITAHPYALVLHKGAIHILARPTDAKDTRVYRFDRMSDVTSRSEERFTLPEGFDPAEFMQGDFGIAPASKRTRVLVEFDAAAAVDLRQRKVHPSQRIAVAPDGRVRLSMSVGDLGEVARWVLGYGSAAVVIEPPELVSEVRLALERALAKYG
jgi:predicted DNA-binding transcriptional regulator YafY